MMWRGMEYNEPCTLCGDVYQDSCLCAQAADVLAYANDHALRLVGADFETQVEAARQQYLNDYAVWQREQREQGY